MEETPLAALQIGGSDEFEKDQYPGHGDAYDAKIGGTVDGALPPAGAGIKAMTTLPQHFHRIRLNLARSKEFPDGSSLHGYEFVVPLDATGHIDTVLWKQHRALCTVRRIWAGEADLYGVLVHKAGGDRGGTWIFDYDGTSDFDDEAGYRFGAHAMQIGEYVSIKDEDGVLHTFIVTSLDAV